MAAFRLSSGLIGRLLVIDVVMVGAATVSWLAVLEVRDVSQTLVMCACMFVLRVLIWATQMHRVVQPATPWVVQGAACSDADVLEAERAIGRAPERLALAYAGAGLVYFGGLMALAWFVLPDTIVFGRFELGAMGFQIGALGLGPPTMILPMVTILVQGQQRELGEELERRALQQERAEVTIAPRLVWLIVGLVLAALWWLSATAWIAQGESARELATQRTLDSARWAAHALALGEGGLEAGLEVVDVAALPDALRPEVGVGALGEAHATIDKRSERVTAAAAVGDGRFVRAALDVGVDRRSFWLTLFGVTLAVVVGGSIAVVAAARSLIEPLHRLRHTLRRVVEVGDLRELGRIPIASKDELGVLVLEFNRMLDMFEQLADASLTVAAGDLRVRLDGQGDLQDAFRAMVARLTELVIQIRTATIEVSSAAAEISAAVSEQERATVRQSEGMREVDLAMQQLEDSAMEITAAAEGVLFNARESRGRSDEVATKIADLGEHIARVSELLGLIHEIADRSDLLALNGSLEATRAGEAGRGFELVAKEMRRLAERVGTTVADVRQTVAAIERAKRETEQVTGSSRKLADETTAAAQQIVDHTGAQSTQTELVASNIQGIVELVVASVSATTQTNAVAESLRERADTLRRLVEQFEVEDAAARAAAEGAGIQRSS